MTGLVTKGLALGIGATLVMPLAAEAAQERRVLHLFGTGGAKVRMVPNEGGGREEATCFTIDMFDLMTGEKVGRARDCLSDIEVAREKGPSLALTGTTYFMFDNGDRVVTRGRTIVQPLTTERATEVTHITGAIPSRNQDNNLGLGVLANLGRGAYQGVSGGARLSGAVNLARLDAEGEITFDCIFVIDLDQ